MSEVNREIGERPELAWVEVDRIRVDENYQRGLRKSRVAQILRDFNWAHFQPVMLGRHEDGTFTVFDGQHRCEAARRHPLVDQVPASIVEFGEGWEEAAAFLGVNVNRTAVTTVEKFWAGIEAGDAAMMSIAAVLEEAECEVVPSGTHSPAPNRTTAVSAIQRSIQRFGDRATIDAMVTLRRAWPSDSRALGGSLIQALARLYRANAKVIDQGRMVEKLTAKDREILSADAHALKKLAGCDASTALGKAIVEIYNRGITVKQIEIGARR